MFKYVSFVFISMFFVSCSFPGDPVEVEEDTTNSENNISLVGGNGSSISPYDVKKNSFFTTNGDKTYFEFYISNDKNTCQAIFYPEDTNNSNFYVSSSVSFTRNDTNKTNRYENGFDSYSSLSKGNYTFYINEDTFKKFAFFSPCLNGFDTITFINDGVHTFKAYNKLYYFDITKQTTLNFTQESNISKLFILNSDFKIVHTNSNFSTFDKTLRDKGRYYIFLRGSKTEESKFKLSFEED